MTELWERLSQSHGDLAAVAGSKQGSLLRREKRLPGDPRQTENLQSVFAWK